MDCCSQTFTVFAWERITLPHPTDGTLGHLTFLAEEMLVDVNVLVLRRSFKSQDVIHHVLFPSALIAGNGAELYLTCNGQRE